jgi:galactokinase/mevalonate kinase-like predicted kinase
MPALIRDILSKNAVEASAPCRVDSGGTWDIKAMALPLQGVRPATVNLALSLRTRVTLLPLARGRVAISSEGFSRREVQPFRTLPFDSPFGIFFAAVSCFGFHGLEARIESDSPVKSALGGSSTALVALVKALSKVKALQGGKEMTAGQVLHLAYHLEDAVSSGKCGIQDQAAAAYGGANLWEWRYGQRGALFWRTPLVDAKTLRELSDRILVAYSGKSHVSSRMNRAWLEGFLSGRTRAGWIKANETVLGLAKALRAGDWNRAARLLREEMAVRREITPDALIPVTAKLIDRAEAEGCGARFTGAGGGGAVWAVGSLPRIERLRRIWGSSLRTIPGARVLECRIDPRGVR